MINVLNLNEMTLDDAIRNASFDIFIGFLCNETRSVHVLKRAYEQCAKRIMIVETRSADSQPMAQHARWAKKAEQIQVVFNDDELEAELLEDAITSKLQNLKEGDAAVSILFDISSMPRSVIATVMATIEDFTSTHSVEMTVAYCLAKYTPPVDHNLANKTVRPVHPSFTGFSIDASLPVAAIVGLGYEKGKALGAVEYIQSTDWWVFVPTSEETKYLKKVEQHNQTILNVVGAERRFEYSVHSPLLTVSHLDSLVSGLKETHKPVFLPFGPKIFFFCSLLVALVHRRCAVWHVVGEASAAKADISTSAYVMCLSYRLEESASSLTAI
jgi:hypothetical protein